MKLDVQKRLAADVMGCSEKRVWFDPERLEEIKESITKADIRNLVNDKAIQQKPKRGISRFSARKIKNQKKKGRRKGAGSRKGKKHARLPSKNVWIAKIRLQRSFLIMLKEKQAIDKPVFRDLYLKAKGGYFRSIRHLKLFITEKQLIKNEKH